jgi:thiamine biosynthesis lipoprotein
MPSTPIPSPSPALRREAGGWVRRQDAIMGTAITVELWADDARQGVSACAAVMDEMYRIDRLLSPHKACSELSRINRDAGTKPVPLSEEVFGLLRQALAFSMLSDGAFDISYAGVGRLYDYRAGVRPDAATLDAARDSVGWQFLELDERQRTLRFARPGMCIDLGGFAKGHAVDNAAALLKRRGIENAYISAGGDSRVIGCRRGRPWSVAVRHPRRADGVVAVLPLEDTAVSTSGDYERYFIDPATGERCHHIVDPATGRSPHALASVTVLAPDGLTAEALSKTVFVLGLARGLEIVESLPGTDAVVVDADGALHFSAGLQRQGDDANQEQAA